MFRGITISGRFVGQVLIGAQVMGADVDELLARAGIGARIQSQPLARIPLDPYIQLLKAIMFELQDECLGLMGQAQPIGTFDTLTRAVLHETSLRGAMQAYVRASRVLNPQIRYEIEIDSERVRFVIILTPGAVVRSTHLFEIAAITAHRFFCWLCRTRIRLSQVDLHYPPQPWKEEYRQLFLGAPVRFDQPRMILHFQPADLTLPTHQSIDALRRYIRRAPSGLFTSFASSSVSDRTRDLILSRLQENLTMPSAREAAAHLGFQAQTYWRRLRDEGTDFTEIRTQTRRDRAIALLTEHDSSVEQIAEALDFSESSAFVRAFRRWTGMTPLAYRRFTGSGRGPRSRQHMGSAR